MVPMRCVWQDQGKLGVCSGAIWGWGGAPAGGRGNVGGCPTAPPLSPIFPVCHQQAVEQKVQEQGQEEAPRGREDVCGRARRSPQTSVPLGHGGASGLSQLFNEQPPARGPGVTEAAQVPSAHTAPVIFSGAQQLRRRKGEGQKIGGNSRKHKVTFCGWSWWLPERFRDVAVRTGVAEGAVQSQFFLLLLAEPAKFRGSFSSLKKSKKFLATTEPHGPEQLPR